MNEKNERVKKITFLDSFLSSIFFSIFIFIPIALAHTFLEFWEEEKWKWKDYFQKLERKHIYAWGTIYLFFSFIIFSLLWFQKEKDERWEKQSKEDIKSTAEELEKQLLTTKTELLLTQNKLRECQESKKEKK